MAPSEGDGIGQLGDEGFSIEDPPESAPGDETPRKAGRRKRDISALVLSNVTLFRGADGAGYAAVPMVREHYETMLVQSREFRLWVRLRAFRDHGATLSGSTLANIVETAETLALNSGDVRKVWRRIAMEGGRIYWALGGSDPAGERRVVEISAEGWTVRQSSEIQSLHFIYTADALPLPEPVPDEAKLEDFRAFIPVEGDDDLYLALAGIIAALRPDAPQGYPGLAISGEQGSGKTFTTACIHTMLDPSEAMLLGLPYDARDFAAILSTRHVFSCDNVSHISDQQSDWVCRAQTGAAHAARELHTNGGVFIAKLKNPILLNGIPEHLSSRPDFADRIIAISLRRLAERRSAEELAAEFKVKLPGLLGLLCHGVSAALRNLPTTNVVDGPRMIDACIWAEAAAPGLGIEPGRITTAWRANRQQADREALAVHEVALAVVALLDEAERAEGRAEWRGDPQGLYNRLCDLAGDRVSRGKSWPRSSASMGNTLRRIAPGLRAVHRIEVHKGKEGTGSTRFWSIRRL